MLILDRHVGESIVIGDNIVLTVVGVNEWGHAKLGIEAPRRVRVMRGELVNEPHGSRQPVAYRPGMKMVRK